MAKRQATYQIGKGDMGDGGEDEVDIPSLNSNPEEIAKRPMKGLPKRVGRTALSSPQIIADRPSAGVFGESPFGKPSIPPLFPPSSDAPQQLPSFSFQPPTKSNTPTSSVPSFSSFQPPDHKPATGAEMSVANKEDENLFKFYASMRGLNHSLLEALQAEIAKDPFFDLENVLTTALKNYSRHIKAVKAAQDANNSTASSTPIVAPSPPSGGFLFGGKSLPTSGTSTPALIPKAAAFIPLKSSSAFPAFIAPGSGAGAPSEGGTDPADDGKRVDKNKDTQSILAAPPPLFSPSAQPATTNAPTESPFGIPKESTEKAPESTTTTKVSPFKPAVFGGSAFGAATNAFKGAPAFGSFGASTTQNEKGGDKEPPKPEAPKSVFGTTSAFGSAATTPTFGSFGASSLPSSGSIGNPVGFSFGSSLGTAKKDDTSSSAQAEATPVPAATGPEIPAFGGATSSIDNKNKSVFGSSAFGASSKSVFGTNTGTSLFGSGGAFGSTSATKIGEGPATPTSPFGSASSFVGFGGGPSVFNPHPTSAPPAAEVSGGPQETESETPPTAFEFTSTDIEGAGEEDETSVYAARGKLLKLVDGKWAPLGLGHFKIKKHKETGKQRVLFRTEGNGHVVANFNVFAGMKLAKQAKLLRFPGMEGSQLVPFGLQLKLPSMVDEAYDALSKASSGVEST